MSKTTTVSANKTRKPEHDIDWPLVYAQERALALLKLSHTQRGHGESFIFGSTVTTLNSFTKGRPPLRRALADFRGVIRKMERNEAELRQAAKPLLNALKPVHRRDCKEFPELKPVPLDRSGKLVV